MNRSIHLMAFKFLFTFRINFSNDLTSKAQLCMDVADPFLKRLVFQMDANRMGTEPYKRTENLFSTLNQLITNYGNTYIDNQI